MSTLVKNTLVKQLQADHPSLLFNPSDRFYWSPKEQTVFYVEDDKPKYQWTLLHETSHGILNHKTFGTDFELLQIEIATWEKAKNIGAKYGINIDVDHIENCLDTYRDWLHKRSVCPKCTLKGLQTSPSLYKCINCAHEWRVSKNRLCRPYRAKATKKAPL